jgi:plastocyanin/FtsP/CotA-like multicopper oxidase with cupredoxin domain
MANLEFWIQLENRPWDASPNGRDRMTGQTIEQITGNAPVSVTLKSPGTGATSVRVMKNPLRDSDGKVADALILRRYRPPRKADQSDAWSVPDDRKVNPWDINEQDPTDTGTMGTIPGPVIECNVGDSVVVHFRNRDHRTEQAVTTQNVCFPGPFGQEICIPIPVTRQQPIAIEKRVHSLHPHGFVFERTKDGAYPLSPPDAAQPVTPGEVAAWASVPGFSGTLKQGDRVPPNGTFTYEWNTFGWPTTAGVWLYHDHSICDMDNVGLGAIGIIVIHNPSDTQQEVDIRLPDDPSAADPAFLPGGSLVGSPITSNCLPLGDVPLLPHQLAGLGMAGLAASPGMTGMAGMNMAAAEDVKSAPKSSRAKKTAAARSKSTRDNLVEETAPERMLDLEGLRLEVDEKLQAFRRLCLPVFRDPPAKALYLQLFHTINGVAGMAINGRTFLGNTPTVLAGTSTRMRFGVVGMGSDVHTFHVHGHRWTLPGPDGTSPGAIQGSAQIAAASQFEDTRIFGAANSFAFTINGASGSFMRAGGPGPDQAIGEWHMHCHVLAHMMSGMMGSLLIIHGGELALGLPMGVPCEMPAMDGGMTGGNGAGSTPTTHRVDMQGVQFSPGSVTINMGDTVEWHNDADPHTVTSNPGSISCSPASSEHFAFGTAAAPLSANAVVSHTFNTAGSFAYHCEFHGCSMAGTIHVNP